MNRERRDLQGWIRPDVLLRFELRQAREEGKIVPEVEAEWLALRRSSRNETSSATGRTDRDQRTLQLLDHVVCMARPLRAEEPEDVHEFLPAVGQPSCEFDCDRLASAWHGRVGAAQAASRRRRTSGAAEVTSSAGPVAAIYEGAAVDAPLQTLLVAERLGLDFETIDVGQLWLECLPLGRLAGAERVAARNLLENRLPPETAVFRNPFREWDSALGRTETYGWFTNGDVRKAAELAWRDARLSHSSNGVYAGMFMAAAHAVALTGRSPSECADVALGVIPSASRLAVAIRFARHLEGPWTTRLSRLKQELRRLHERHAVATGALIALTLYSAGTYSEALSIVSSSDTVTPSTAASIGSLFGASEKIDPGRRTELRAHSSLPTFSDLTPTGIARRIAAATSGEH
ncbi:MAG: hypothetical protein QOH16_685 [Gaiellaceae bacterium]|nr:hypothetical protein [Gaiellaceae bacterium]